jgi:ribonuclease P protein component
MLPPRHRLRRSVDVQRTRLEGRRWQHPLLVLFVREQPEQESSVSRFAFAAGRRLGKANRRNRVKRRLRHIVRHHLDSISPGMDILIIARTPAALAGYDALEKSVIQLMVRAGVWQEETANDLDVLS